VKHLTAILAFFVISSTATGLQLSEGAGDLNQDFGFGKHPVSSSSSPSHDIAEEDKEVKIAHPSNDNGGGVEPDSSYYSVNKFNFLFYFVYKLKYMEDYFEEESTNPAQEE